MLAAAAFVASMALASVQAAPISLNVVEAAVSTPNTTQTNDVVNYEMNGNAGACTWYNKDSDVVVGLPLEFYSNLGSVSPYCGQFVVIKNLQNNETTTALVADASSMNNTLSVSLGTWAALNGTESNLKTVDWRFANATETADAKAALAGDSSSSSSSSSSSYVAPSSSSVAYVAPSSSSSSAAASTSSSAAPKQQQQQEETTTTTYQAPKTTTTSYTPPKTTTTSYTPPKTTTTWAAPQTTTKAASSGSSGQYSGQATFFSQGGAAGSCGNYNSDSAYIVAVSASMMNSGYCGRQVHITNTANGQSITATVADTCPGCGYGSLDLSIGAFGAIGNYDAGVLPISWSFA